MKQLPLLFLFYRNYLLVPGLIVSAICWYSSFKHGFDALVILVFVKLIADLIIYGVVSASARDRMLYYFNRHFAKNSLWAFAILTDLIIFILIACIAVLIR